MQARFLGRSLYEAAPVPVPQEVERVQVEAGRAARVFRAGL